MISYPFQLSEIKRNWRYKSQAFKKFFGIDADFGSYIDESREFVLNYYGIFMYRRYGGESCHYPGLFRM